MKNVKVNVYKNVYLIPGGMPFGVKFYTDGVGVVGLTDVVGTGGATSNPGYEAGIRPKDIIIKADGTVLSGAGDFTDFVENSAGRGIKLTLRRGDVEFECTLYPKYCESEGKYKSGLYLRDSGAGIGTVTFITTDGKSFGGLGHGICDGETGELVTMRSGSVSDVTVNGLIRGLAGSPGEIKGFFNSGKIGTLRSNTDCGVFGVLSSLPDGAAGEKMQIGLRGEVQAGEAYILCTLGEDGIGKYTVEITDINRSETGSKCFGVKIKDEKLIGKTGGIIQGMSGSPIIQNGKIIGAVTHVLINDPTRGYGIFIENMLGKMAD